jgi:uncharacterized protein DUF6431
LTRRKTYVLLWLSTPSRTEVFVFILSISEVDDKAYRYDPALVRDRVSACPFCGRRLGRNGGYSRNIPNEATYESGVIFRMYCSSCKVSFSLIPGFILPWHSYSRKLIVEWLLERLRGTPYRSQHFLVQQNIGHTPADSETSWSDMVDFERTYPGYQRFHGWTSRFSRAAQGLLGPLLAAMVWLDLDLQAVAVKVTAIQPIAAPTSPLALAMSLVYFLPPPRGPDAPQLGDVLGRVVGMLVMRRLDASHKIRRAFGDRFHYDTLVI